MPARQAPHGYCELYGRRQGPGLSLEASAISDGPQRSRDPDLVPGHPCTAACLPTTDSGLLTAFSFLLTAPTYHLPVQQLLRGET